MTDGARPVVATAEQNERTPDDVLAEIRDSMANDPTSLLPVVSVEPVQKTRRGLVGTLLFRRRPIQQPSHLVAAIESEPEPRIFSGRMRIGSPLDQADMLYSYWEKRIFDELVTALAEARQDVDKEAYARTYTSKEGEVSEVVIPTLLLQEAKARDRTVRLKRSIGGTLKLKHGLPVIKSRRIREAAKRELKAIPRSLLDGLPSREAVLRGGAVALAGSAIVVSGVALANSFHDDGNHLPYGYGANSSPILDSSNTFTINRTSTVNHQNTTGFTNDNSLNTAPNNNTLIVTNDNSSGYAANQHVTK